MVYTKVYIVFGLIVDRRDLRKILKKVNLEYSDDEYHYLIQYHKDLTIEARRIMNHEKDPSFWVGIILHTYSRYIMHCLDCPKLSSCDMCIGSTSNGYYNITEITKEPQEVNIRNICMYCFHDNRVDLKTPISDWEIIDGKIQIDKSFKSNRCTNCNQEQTNRFSPETVLKREFMYERMKKLSKSEPKLYYILDDCLCCT